MSQNKATLIKDNVDKAYTNTEDTRDRGADDWMFAHYNHWDETLEEYSDNEYRGQFDIITRQLRQVKGEMLANPISVKFRPSENTDTSKNQSEILQGMYRASMRNNMAKEAIDVAIDCQVSAGMGGWRLVTEYEDQGDNTETKQVIRRKPVHEANNVMYFDPQAKRKDKSDAKWGCLLTWYTDDAYKELLEDYGINPDSRTPTSMKQPATSYTFTWNTGERNYIGEYYEVEEKKQKIFILEDQFGNTTTAPRRSKAKLAELADEGYEVIGRKEITKRIVNKYIVDGEGIIEGPIEVAGKHIPLIPLFGEWRFIEGNEYWEGLVRRAKDPQRLHNMAFSFIADQVGRTPRRKPFFAPEQIKGYEHMYLQDADYPYYMLNLKDANGQPLPMQPLGYMEGPTINGAETQFLQMTEKAVNDVTVTPIVGENAMSDGVTEGQLRLANSQNQMQTFIFQDSLATAMRRDGEVYMSMATDIYTDEMQVVVMAEDDTADYVTINKESFDAFGRPSIENEIKDSNLEVYTDIGPRYQDMKVEAMVSLQGVVRDLGAQDPLGRVAMLQYMSMLDIPADSAFEEFVSKERLKMGIKKPDTPEEMQYMQQLAQQAQSQKNPQAQLAQAEAQARMMEGQAAIQNEVNDANKIKIDVFKAETDRQKLEIDAAKAGVSIQKDRVDTEGKQIDNAIKLADQVGVGA